MSIRHLSIALALLGAIAPAHATTTRNALFVCDGVLLDIDGDYYIKDVVSQFDNPMTCLFDKGEISSQIFSVCHIGDHCIVSAKGESGNGNYHFIEKIFEVQHRGHLYCIGEKNGEETYTRTDSPENCVFAAPTYR
jgi:hypothetical protein